MHITVNSEDIDHKGDGSLSALLKEMGIESDRVAIMINGDVIKKSDIAATKIEENSCIDILTLAAGG